MLLLTFLLCCLVLWAKSVNGHREWASQGKLSHHEALRFSQGQSKRKPSLGDWGHPPRRPEQGVSFCSITASFSHLLNTSLVALVTWVWPPARDLGLIPGSGRSPGGGNGNPLQYSHLENPVDRGVWRATVMGSQRVGHDLARTHAWTLIGASHCLSPLLILYTTSLASYFHSSKSLLTPPPMQSFASGIHWMKNL